MKKRNSGFTLVELAIVIVIIGLVISTVLVGENIIKAAKIKSVISDFNRLKTAFDNFNTRYEAYPGDMPNASKYFSDVPNGNGDRYIDHIANSASPSSEAAIASAHLQKAGFIEGEYSLTSSNPATDNVGIESNYNNAQFLFSSKITTKNIAANCASGTVALRLGIPIALSDNTHMRIPVFSTDEVINIEKKFDDGFPETGEYFGCNGEGMGASDITTSGYCINNTVSPTIYDTSDLNSIFCTLSYSIR